MGDFALASTILTQEHRVAVMGSNPSCFRNGDTYPVKNVSWNDCQVFIKN